MKKYLAVFLNFEKYKIFNEYTEAEKWLSDLLKNNIDIFEDENGEFNFEHSFIAIIWKIPVKFIETDNINNYPCKTNPEAPAYCSLCENKCEVTNEWKHSNSKIGEIIYKLSSEKEN